jgi:molybdopterin synthase catalytic subunit
MTHKIADARVVHYAVGIPSVGEDVKTIILCGRHRQSFYSLHSDAWDYGERRPVEECAHCAIDAPR